MQTISVLGAGRMGQELIRAIAASEDLELAGWWRRDGKPAAADLIIGAAVVSADLDAVLGAGDVAVDFTLPTATPRVADSVVRLRKPLVCGVSGLGDDALRQLREASRSVPVLYDRNMSFGMAVLDDLVRRAAAALGPEFVAEIHETHHVHKLDAPSGTALKLGEALAAARGQDFERVYRYEEGRLAERRSPGEILFSAVRAGENPGEHTVLFRSQAETLELAHRVRQRRVFALGALQAARWLLLQQPGFYGMRDLAACGS